MVQTLRSSRKVAGSLSDGIVGIFGVNSGCNRNEYQGYILPGKCDRYLRLTTLPPSCSDCLEILGTSTFWSPEGLSWSLMGYLYLYLYRTAFIHSFLCLSCDRSVSYSDASSSVSALSLCLILLSIKVQLNMRRSHWLRGLRRESAAILVLE